MENGGENRSSNSGIRRNDQESYGGRLSTALGETKAEREERLKHATAPGAEPDARPDKDEAAKTRRSRRIAYALAGLLALAALASAVWLALTPDSTPAATKKPKESAYRTQSAAATETERYLAAQPWDNKQHGSMKSLKKVKNLRYALAFFQSFTPQQAAAVPAQELNLADVATNYKELVGSMVAFAVKLGGKDEVAEDLELNSSEPSCLLTLPGGAGYGSATLLVLGSQLPDVNTGDTVKCACIPVYFNTPEDGGGGGLLFVTIPELVKKQ